jgi:hypothetical protein
MRHSEASAPKAPAERIVLAGRQNPGRSGPGRYRRHGAWTFNIDRAEVRRPGDLQIFHVLRIIEQIMDDAGTLMNAIACLNQRQPVFVHEARPALEHDHDVEVGDVPVPARASFRRFILDEEVTEAVGNKVCVAFLDMRKAGFSRFFKMCCFHCHISFVTSTRPQLEEGPTSADIANKVTLRPIGIAKLCKFCSIAGRVSGVRFCTSAASTRENK